MMEPLYLLVLKPCAIRLHEGAEAQRFLPGQIIRTVVNNGRHAYEDLVNAGILQDERACPTVQ